MLALLGAPTVSASDGTATPRITPQNAAHGALPALADDARGYAPDGSCVSCHQTEASAWQDSDHGWAMRDATPDNVLGNFDDAVFADGDVKARFDRDGDTFIATVQGPDDPARRMEIAYTFGVRPLQQYLVAMPGGRLQALTIAWDSRPADDGGQRWFSLYPGEAFAPDDPLHYTGRYQNWNAMCADCHSTNLDKGYEAETDTFATTWHEQSVGCQSCHGPSQRHLDWAESLDGDGYASATTPANAPDEPPNVDQPGAYEKMAPSVELHDIGATDMGLPLDLGAMNGPELVEQCATCHSRRQMLGAGPSHGQPLTDVALASPLSEGLYHADGQIQGEVYVYGSFTQSAMYQNGVTCTDCHDPHSARVKIQGNGLCTQCHNPAPPSRFPGITPANYDSVEHHHHAPDSEGAQCVSCHMPETTYMQVDPRRDHSFRVPRPDLSAATGSPNACASCHQNDSDEHHAATVNQWFGELSRANQEAAGERSPHFGVTFQAARQGDPAALEGLIEIATDAARPDIVRATAVDELASYGTAALPTLEDALHDESARVRAAAAPVFAQAPEGARVERLLPLVEDPRLAVRDEAVKALAGTSLMVMPEDQRETFLAARRDYEQRLRDNADLPGNRLNLAVLLERTAREDEAVEQYRQALVMDPYFLPARANLVTLLSRTDDTEQAEQTLRDGLALDAMPTPDRGHLAYLLALSLAEQGRTQASVEWLEKSAQWRPDHVRTHYNLGLVLDRLGRKDEAMAALETGLEVAPRDPDLLYALVYLYATAGRIPQALDALATLRQVRPDDPRLGRLEAQLRGQ
ncbi:tetratricopeptide repeat protein [Halomonas sp. V046]|uniref:tetratricopeptide repeat protein n=1 Tax=Halomonas sp. V046 TaxID=3459611 RepID=UPI004044DED6